MHLPWEKSIPSTHGWCCFLWVCSSWPCVCYLVWCKLQMGIAKTRNLRWWHLPMNSGNTTQTFRQMKTVAKYLHIDKHGNDSWVWMDEPFGKCTVYVSMLVPVFFLGALLCLCGPVWVAERDSWIRLFHGKKRTKHSVGNQRRVSCSVLKSENSVSLTKNETCCVDIKYPAQMFSNGHNYMNGKSRQ